MSFVIAKIKNLSQTKSIKSRLKTILKKFFKKSVDTINKTWYYICVRQMSQIKINGGIKE